MVQLHGWSTDSLAIPVRLDGPPRPVQPRQYVRGQPPPTELHPGMHQIQDISEHRSPVSMDSLSNKNARAEARRDPIYQGVAKLERVP